MIINDASWTKITDGTGAVLQKTGKGFISLAYSSGIPAGVENFGLIDSAPITLPTVSGKDIYAKSSNGDVNLSVQIVTATVVSGISGTLTSQKADITGILVGDIKRLEFDPPIRGADFKVRAAVGVTLTDDDGILFVYGNHTAGVAEAWLTDESLPGPRITLMPSDGILSKEFDGGLVSFVDIIGVGSPTLVVTVGGLV